MSVADLKQRLHDVPGIHTLSMVLEAGKIMLHWGEGHSAAVDATASDTDIATAVRNAARLPPVSLIPEKETALAAPVATAVPPAAVAPAAPAPSPAIQTTGQAPMTTSAPSAPGAHALNIQERLAQHSQKLDAILQQQGAMLDVMLSDQLNTVVSATDAVMAKVKAQTDDFKAIMGQFSNLLPGS